MKDLSQFRRFSPEERALICVAVLFDGLDAGDVLATDVKNGAAFRKIAKELASLSPDVRMPLVGTLLRELVHGELRRKK